MAKKYPFESILSSAGERFNFPAGKRMDLDVDQAKELLTAGAVRPLDPKMPKSFYPSGKAPAAPPKSKGGNSDGQPANPVSNTDGTANSDAGGENNDPDPNADAGSTS